MFFQLSKSFFYRMVQVFSWALFVAICLMATKSYLEYYNAKIESQQVTDLKENSGLEFVTNKLYSGTFQETIENKGLGIEGQEKRIAADPSHRQTKQSDFLGRLLTSGGFLG